MNSCWGYIAGGVQQMGFCNYVLLAMWIVGLSGICFIAWGFYRILFKRELSTKILIAGIILDALALCAWCFLSVQAAASYQTYQGDGFNLSYPQAWTATNTDKADSSQKMTVDAPGNEAGLAVFVSDYSGAVSDLVSLVKQRHGEKIDSEEDLTLSDIPAHTITVDDPKLANGNTIRHKLLLVVYKGKGYIVDSEADLPLWDKYSPVLDKLLHSFTLAK